MSKNNQNVIKVLGQGTYGCAVKPHKNVEVKKK